ncbi:hypothetical protein [Enterovibrio nigricans]|uniref:Chromosome segregation ATPase n=1 Tax=Enterovibrio nigricans DSM 22720 TaxID=1121868 RepID=A0A1T4UI61_9GAMM|nr:hypothetical protein [Enterovibrio nigricans]PKF50431.1 hypothetical protein AT251_11695 [Enterovibrio nigricans]SKA52384.1 hypothetical protein SAMN02745132_01808 [Enterovibrio nigricans DSM 22720]
MTNMKKILIVLIANGIAFSGYLTVQYLSSNQLSSQHALEAVIAQREATNLKLAASRDEVTALAHEIDAKNTKIETLLRDISEKESSSQSLQTQINTHQQAYAQQLLKREETIAALDSQIAALKQRIVDTDKLYAQRYSLAKQVGDLNERILKASHKAELSKTACEEFKQGNSWNWVSEEDCNNFNKWRQEGQQLIVEFENKNRELDGVNRQIATFNAS